MTAAYADTRYRTMQAVQTQEGIKALCYDQQARLVESLIEPGMTVLDVGCGPSLPYHAPYAYVLGLDPSAASLAANTDVDERIVGTATRIPLPDASVDLVVAFYALHHITAPTIWQSRLMRIWALSEMRRVLRPGGTLLVFEMQPYGWAARLQGVLWPLVRQLLGARLDTYFWVPAEMPAQTFACSPWATFAPVFTLPWLKLPRLLYPFDAVCYRWRKPDARH